jgi:hypothetical protein
MVETIRVATVDPGSISYASTSAAIGGRLG